MVQCIQCLGLSTFTAVVSWLVIGESLISERGIYRDRNSPGKNTGVGSHSLLQGIFTTQGLNLGLLHCRQILYQLSYSSIQFEKLVEETETSGV